MQMWQKNGSDEKRYKWSERERGGGECVCVRENAFSSFGILTGGSLCTLYSDIDTNKKRRQPPTALTKDMQKTTKK